MALASNALVTKIELEDYLEQEGSDSIESENLETVINGISTFFESYCDRSFYSTTYTEYMNGSGVKYLIPDNFPIISVTSIYNDSDWVWPETDLVDSTDYRITNDKMTILKDGTWSLGDENIKLTYVAGYTTIPDDLKLACLQQCTYEVKMISNKQSLAITLPDGSISFNNITLVPIAQSILKIYKRISVL